MPVTLACYKLDVIDRCDYPTCESGVMILASSKSITMLVAVLLFNDCFTISGAKWITMDCRKRFW